MLGRLDIARPLCFNPTYKIGKIEMKTLFAPTPSFSPPTKPSHAPQARQGVLVTDPQLVNEMLRAIETHNFKSSGFGWTTLREEPKKISNMIGSLLGINPQETQVQTLRIDGHELFKELCDQVGAGYGSRERGDSKEAVIRTLNFLKNPQEERPVALQIGQLTQRFEPTGSPDWRRHYNRNYYEYEPKDSPSLSPNLGRYPITTSSTYERNFIPLVGEKIDNQPSVIGYIPGSYDKSLKKYYIGTGTSETLEAFLNANPKMFSDTSKIKNLYA